MHSAWYVIFSLNMVFLSTWFLCFVFNCWFYWWNIHLKIHLLYAYTPIFWSGDKNVRLRVKMFNKNQMFSIKFEIKRRFWKFFLEKTWTKIRIFSSYSSGERSRLVSKLFMEQKERTETIEMTECLGGLVGSMLDY